MLALATQAGRVLVTHDRKTMPKYFATFIGHTSSSGLIVIPQKLPVRAAVEDLLLIWTASEAEEWISPPYTFSLLNGDIKLNRDWQLFV